MTGERATYIATCPVCKGAVARRGDGTLYPHTRYVDGGGYGSGLSHEQVTCEGSTAAERGAR